MRFIVLEYNREQDYHVCEMQDGSKVRLDIMVDGGFTGRTPESLVGKAMVCDYVSPFIEIASNVREEAAQS